MVYCYYRMIMRRRSKEEIDYDRLIFYDLRPYDHYDFYYIPHSTCVRFLSYNKFFKPVDWLWDKAVRDPLCLTTN